MDEAFKISLMYSVKILFKKFLYYAIKVSNARIDFFCEITNFRLFKIASLTRECIISNVVLRHVSDMVLFTTRKFGWTVNSRRSCSNNDSDHVSLIGRHLALLPSRLKSQGGVLTKPEQLIGLIFAHQ